MTDEEMRVIENMDNWGGTFVKNLASCFRTADAKNFAKLKRTFPEYWEIYSSKDWDKKS